MGRPPRRRRGALLPLACVVAPALAGKRPAQLAGKLWAVGPFASGKAEYDGDPLAAEGGARALFREAGPGSRLPRRSWRAFLSEHARGGEVAWEEVSTSRADDGSSAVVLPFQHVPFRELMERPPLGGSSDVLHVQYWAVWALRVRAPGRYGVDCRGLHTFEVLPDAAPTGAVLPPLAGNVYSESSGAVAASVEFPAEGAYRIYARVRGKAPLQFSCNVRAASGDLEAWVYPPSLPDVVLGRLIAGASPVALRLRNGGGAWLRVRPEVRGAAGGLEVSGAAAEEFALAPGASALLPVVVSVRGPTEEREAASCAGLRVVLRCAGCAAEPQVPVQLRCRKSTQSALLSFLDADGSVGVAAVLRPRDPRAAGPLPVVVSMSGVGVGPQQQADAYKMKLRPDDPGDYIFGFDRLWVLAPQRGGPHNWEDVGMRTALRAIDVLAASFPGGVDGDRLVVHGHSRGGHGAWGLATRVPDRVLGVSSACGWYSREAYGDANNLWVHETSLMHLDKALLGLLHASVAENENSLFASNLLGLPALVRVASRDAGVPPWFGRRMARHLREEGVNVTLQEFDQEHWWWDTKRPNDGGVMHDDEMRAWTERAAGGGLAPRLADALAQRGVAVVAAGGPEYEGRHGVRVLARASPAARAFVRIRLRSEPRRVELRTANARRIAIRPGSEVAALSEGAVDVDGEMLAISADRGLELCRAAADAGASEAACAADWSAAERRRPSWAPCPAASTTRGPRLMGPIRKIFAEPWVVVVPDAPTALETALAVYFATGHAIAVDTTTQVVTASEAAPLRSSRRFVWLGTAPRLPAAASWPVDVTGASLEVGPCRFQGPGYGAAFLAPAADAPGSDSLLDLVVTATSEQALVDLVSFSFATNQPHTRAPMSNMLPDFLVTGPEFRWRGYGGVVAAGYWDERWLVAPDSAYFQC